MTVDPESAGHLVLRNDEGQYSLWPERRAVPEGWAVAMGPAERQACLDYVEATWTDMRPLSLQAAS